MNPRFRINGIPYQKWIGYSFSDVLSKSVAKYIEEWDSSTETFLFKTSGSTGKPKTISLSRKCLEHSAKTTCSFLNLKEGDTILLSLPLEFIGGRMMLIRSLVLGLNIELSNPQIREITKHRSKLQFCAMTPLQVSKIIEVDYKYFDNVEILIIGGGKVDLNLEKHLLTLKTKCYATYGMTETASHVALREISNSGNSLFVALNGVGFSINIYNQLIIDAPKWGVQNLLTNDIVHLVSDTEFEWKGRIDNVINSGGVKIYPERVENVLSEGLSTPFFITSIPDKLFENKVVLFVEGEKREIDFLNLSKFEIPKEIYFLTHFYYTQTGKIDRKKTSKMISK